MAWSQGGWDGVGCSVQMVHVVRGAQEGSVQKFHAGWDFAKVSMFWVVVLVPLLVLVVKLVLDLVLLCVLVLHWVS